MDKEEILKLKKRARQRTSDEIEKSSPLNMTLEELGYTVDEAYGLGHVDCEIIMSRKILDILDIRY